MLKFVLTSLLVTVFLILSRLSVAQALAWPDSSGPKSVACYRIPISPLQASPPLHTDMGWQTLLGYVWLDSLMRHPLADSDWTRLQAVRGIDSVRQVLRYLNAVIGYDPVLFNEYCQHGQNLASYWGRPSSAVAVLDDVASTALGADTAHLLYLAGTSYILDVVIEASQRSGDSVHGGAFGDVCVQALIVDTIKGKNLPLTACDSIHYRPSQPKGYPISSAAGCLKIFFDPLWSRTGEDNSGYGVKNDTVILGPTALGFDALVPGHEYIVFLRTIFLDYDGVYSYYALAPVMDGNGGVYEVVGGSVSDPINKWGLGSQVPVAKFKSALRAKLEAIMNP